VRSLRLSVLCEEHRPLFPQKVLPNSSIHLCATVEASECQDGELTIFRDKTKATLLTGSDVIQLPAGSYNQHFEWLFIPVVHNTKIRFNLNAEAGSLIQKADYFVEV
jgi:hypothetical protein